ncbi:MAG: hypothetical protein ABIO80_04980 [Sphingomicrobium sp.]
MLRSIIAIGAIMLGAAPAAAASYSATLSVPTAGRFIVRDISWSCTAAGCAGTTENSRPVVLCQ